MQVRGAAHCHSTLSFDGKLTHRQLRELFQARGFHFVLMSEHIEYQTAETLQASIEACARESTADFLFVPGIEIDDLHILLYGVPVLPASIEPLDLFRHARAIGSLVAISHPLKIRGPLHPEVVDGVAAVEIWNGRYDGKLFPRWPNLRYLKVGHSPVPIIGHDLHSAADIAKLAIQIDVARLEAGEILSAIRAGKAQLVKGQRPIRLDRSDVYRSATGLYTGARDMGYRVNHAMRKSRVPVPRFVRKALKRIL